MAVYHPLIKDYDKNLRLVNNNINNESHLSFSKVKNDFNFNYWDDIMMSIHKCVKFYGFGNRLGMRGKFCCDFEKLKEVHNYLKQLFVKGNLIGNIVINRSSLPHQHFVLDFDLKHFNCSSNKRLSYLEYMEYINKNRRNSNEKYLMNNDCNDLEGNSNDDIKYNTNYFIYEILYYLTEILKINWLPIYILGKNGTFNNGFHIEIPDLIMSYHDISLLSFYCNSFIPNIKILDIIYNYSIFGSQKITQQQQNTPLYEMEYTYLPYAVFYKNEFSTTQVFSNLDEVFDTFNIIKPYKKTTKVYGFKIMTSSNVVNNEINENLYNLLYDCKNYKKDYTIPEYLNSDNNNNDDNIAETTRAITSLLRNDNNDNNNYDCQYIYSIGYLKYQSFLQFSSKIYLYKNILLNKDEDFIEYTDINNQYLDFNNCLNNKNNNWKMPQLPYIQEDDVQLCIQEIPRYYTSNMKKIDIKLNFSTYAVSLYNINVYNDNDDDDDDNVDDDDDDKKFKSFLNPFLIEHIFQLTFGDFGKRVQNTIFYLISIYMLSEKIKPINSFIKNWLYHLSRKGILDIFLNIFFIMKSKQTDNLLEINSNQQNWAVLCLKHLLINYNVMKLDNCLYNNTKDDNRDDNDNNNNNNNNNTSI